MAKLAKPFTSRERRFRHAVVVGFSVTAIGAATLAAGSVGFADDLLGIFGALFQPQQSYQQYSQSGYSQETVARGRPRYARRRTEDGNSVTRVAARHEKPVRLGRESVCVRLCDGFAFPVGTYHGEEDRAAHEATCHAECPGSRTALYVLPNGSDQIGDAVEARTGHAYSKIPAAFHYTTYIADACSCHPHEGNRIASLLRDFTLRRGDAVMTPSGVKVFHGSMGHFPYRQADFVALAKSRDIHETHRAAFHAIESASVPAVVAGTKAPADPKAAEGIQPAAYEKQASLAP